MFKVIKTQGKARRGVFTCAHGGERRIVVRARGSDPQPQSSSLALPCQILVSVDGCQSLAAFGSCIHWMRAPSRRPITPAGTVGKVQGGLPLGNPVCLWQTELFK